MGATTWSYPDEYISQSHLIMILNELRHAFYKTYSGYLDKTKLFEKKPLIGNRWPADGYYLPNLSTLKKRFENKASYHTLTKLLQKTN